MEKKRKRSKQLGQFRGTVPGYSCTFACVSIICRCVCAESEGWVGRKRKKQWRRGKWTYLQIYWAFWSSVDKSTIVSQLKVAACSERPE